MAARASRIFLLNLRRDLAVGHHVEDGFYRLALYELDHGALEYLRVDGVHRVAGRLIGEQLLDSDLADIHSCLLSIYRPGTAAGLAVNILAYAGRFFNRLLLF